ncbi:MAG: hypothetical protein AAF721_41980 [Myxococcota bacterium]
MVALACATQLAFAPPSGGDNWDATEPGPTLAATDSGGEAAAPVGPPEAQAPDSALVAKNRQLTDRMHKGEAWMIGGRIGVGVSAVPILIGIISLGVHGARRRAYRATLGTVPPPTNRARNIGIGFLVVGVAGMTTSAVFAALGFREVQEARAGRVSATAESWPPRHRRDVGTTAWRCVSLTDRFSQRRPRSRRERT